MKKQLVFSSIFILSMLLPLDAYAGWKKIFNGKDLTGWVQKNGKAKYYVENGELVGETVSGTGNSFLCTKTTYSDFILEYDVKLTASVNSGVQIRSESTKDYRNYRVHGYQVEIDPSARAWTGGIYDEARRGWLNNLKRNPRARKAFKMGQWNHFHVEAIGNSIRTWVNKIPCADLVDDMTSKGFIGLQVHSIGKNKDLAGKKIRWKNIRIKTKRLKPRKPNKNIPQISYLTNTLTAREKARGWKLLWDGKTSNGWVGAKLDYFPKTGWQIKDGVLTVLESGGAESRNGGDIVTIREYGNFILEVDFKITKGANSGIKYFVDPKLNKGPGSAIGCEFQILDDKNHPDAKKGINSNRTMGSLYDLIQASSNYHEKSKKRVNSIGSWNRARIVVKGGHVEHWLNNEKVVEYDRYTQMFNALVAYSKYKVWPNFGQKIQGRILLQDHGNTVSFKNIKILELK